MNRLSMKKLLLFAMSFNGIVASYSQQLSGSSELTGSLIAGSDEVIADALVQLLKAKDSSLVKTEFTDEKGIYRFLGIAPGDYFIQANVLGYKSYSGSVFSVNEKTLLEPFLLVKSEVTLNEVTVTTRKAYIEREQGKMIVNVENSIASAGSSAFEVIEKSPGVKIDNNDNISFKGKQGVNVWIDGKPTPMTGADLANYLRGIPSFSIEKIEFIANPSAKYDASGTAIINVKLKKDKRVGTNGTLSLAYGQGVYPKSNNGFTFNHRNKKVNLYVNYNNAFRKGYNSLRLDRNFYASDTFKGAYVQNNYLVMDFKNHIAKMGVDYFIDSKNTIAVAINGANNRFNPTGDNVAQVYDDAKINTSYFETQNRSRDWWYNNSINFNYKHLFDSLGSELTTDIDYAHYGNQTQQNFTTRYFNLSNQEYQSPYMLYGDINGGLDIYSVKGDYAKPLKYNTRLESGIKSSYVVADNNVAFYDKSNGLSIYDSTKSNHFIYTENINAVYTTFAKEWKKISAQMGLRVENTHITGNQLVYHSSFDTSYTQLFPSAFIGYQVNEKHSVELNYSRRIERAGYNQLNPFKYYLDPTTYKSGNPYLQPQTTHSFELTHVYKQKIYTTASFGRTNKNIIEVIAPAPNQQKLTIQTYYNLSRAEVYSLNVSVPFEVSKWWYTANDVNLFYATYSGNLANTTITNVGNINVNINTVNTFNFSSTFSGELSGNYRAKEVYAFETVKPIGYINLGFQKKFVEGRAVIKLSFNDVFHSNRARATTRFTGYVESYDVSRDTRVITFSFVYKLGNTSVSPAQRRKGGAEDIKQRAGGAVG